MTKRMLIDASHAEETRVVVLDGTRLEDFDVETSTKRQLKGNIYLAKVVRVEPSLQAAFVEYGGNRHGFLAFSEIHPDYYQIPVADRQRLIEMQAEEARRDEEEEDRELARSQAPDQPEPARIAAKPEPATAPEPPPESWALASTPRLMAPEPVASFEPADPPPEAAAWATPGVPPLVVEPAAQALAIEAELVVEDDPEPVVEDDLESVVEDDPESSDSESYDPNGDHIEPLPPPEMVGGGDQENGDEQRERRMPPRFMRNYKIQEVIRRRQILLVQVVKEERGTKGAALTTYLSLAGRFGVLMPNSPRGGGISRKITSAADRRRLKEVMAELDIPRGMGMIVRTAGANRPKPEIKRDCEYLLRLWDDIRDHTMKSVAPALIYEEASLIKRAIRDVYSRDIDEILVDGEEGWRAAHDFMRMLMPSHAKKVQLWRDGGQPLFARNQVEAQLDGMLMPTVQLRSGGYLVINQAEALVAIDVNSGRSTRERNIEETALRTNLEAADEVARQLRLRDLAGLIVIDFIDMESKRHNAMVERRIKEALKNDRARIQVGHISHFGLLEMSRQRLRPSLAETSFILCPHCGGTGHVRSTENAAIHVLRGIEDEGSKRRSAEIIVHVSTPVALYLLNQKRERLQEIELRYTMRVIIAADDAQIAPQFRIERVRTRSPDELPVAVTPERSMLPPPVVDTEDEEAEEAEAVGSEDDDDEEEDTPEQRAADAAGGGADEAERRRKRRRRRRRGVRRDDQSAGPTNGDQPAGAPNGVSVEPAETGDAVEAEPEQAAGASEETDEIPTEASGQEPSESAETTPAADDDPRNRRRGRRGGRRRRRENDGELSPFAVPGADQPELQPVYAGPTPADPFGGRAFDIFDVMDQAERAAETKPAPRTAASAEIVNAAAPEPEASNVESEPLASTVEEPRAPPSAPDTPEQVQPEREILNTAAPEPAGEPQMVPGERVAASLPTPANDTIAEIDASQPAPAEPLIKPILIGAGGEPPAEPKRGWWRR
ncbi:MAG: Rne/Rng family ribonuclease [Rhodopila sp.]|jgi:ribonuclease E